jgi:hypothetical protein
MNIEDYLTSTLGDLEKITRFKEFVEKFSELLKEYAVKLDDEMTLLFENDEHSFFRVTIRPPDFEEDE